MTLVQAAAAITLWESRRFDAADISGALGIPESEICIVLNAKREREHGPDLRVVEAENTGDAS